MRHVLPVPATTRPIKLHEVVLIVMSRAGAHDDGVTAENLTLLLMHEPMASEIANKSLNSIYASMSGMQTQPRQWIVPAVSGRRGRNARYIITDAGRSRARTLLAEIETKELTHGA